MKYLISFEKPCYLYRVNTQNNYEKFEKQITFFIRNLRLGGNYLKTYTYDHHPDMNEADKYTFKNVMYILMTLKKEYPSEQFKLIVWE